MKKTTVALFALLLAACGGTDGISPESSRQPKGNPNGVVLVEEFADLQCPACKGQHEEVIGPFLEKYGNQVKFVHKHFPIRSIHRYALEASMASECAADQGKFWEYVDIAFAEQEQMTIAKILEWGKDIGVADYELFERCFKKQVKKKTVLADYREGKDRGVNGTPSFFVNGVRIQNGPDALENAVKEALEGNSQPL